MKNVQLLTEQRIKEILETKDCLKIVGTRYYVANDGDDANDGKSEKTPWKTLKRVSDAELLAGDGVLFRRGDLFRGSVMTKSGVSYGAYGDGPKPRFYAGEKDYADPELWENYADNIWHLKDKVLDVGTLVFNHGQKHSVKLIPSYINGKFVCRDDESKLFDVKNEMVRDLDVYWYFEDELTDKPSKGENFPIPDTKGGGKGDIYLRCDAGNPGAVFDSIEAVSALNMFKVGVNENVTIDNLCIKYVGRHGVSAGGKCNRGLTVTNCEFGWIGGAIQHYFGTDPNYPQGGRGTVTRYGNAIEIYGGCDNYTASNNYIYEVYDAGITHQVSTGGKMFEMTNIRYTDNVIEKCVYGIEYFLDENNGDTGSFMKNIVMSGNIIRLSGYGWGQQRHNTDTPALIKGWSYVNNASEYEISNNVFDRCAYRMLHLVARDESSLPVMKDNIYLQTKGGMIGQYGANRVQEPDVEIFDDDAQRKIAEIFCDKDAKVYYV